MKLSLILGFAALASASFWNPKPKPTSTKTPGHPYGPTPTPTSTPSWGKPHWPKPTPKAPHKKCAKICAAKPLKTCGEGYTAELLGGCHTCCIEAGGDEEKRHMGRAMDNVAM